MNMNNFFTQTLGGLFLAVVFCLANITSAAEDPAAQIPANAEARGLEIAQLRKQKDSGWTNSEAEMTMVLINPKGESSARKIRVRSLEVVNDGDKTLVIFDDPLDVKGTAFLNHSHPKSADNQWLYLPALKRVKRIASQNKSGPFMGSEFSYEDLSSFEIDKFTYRFLREDQLQDLGAFILEQIPTDPHSGYVRQMIWLEKDSLRPLKIEFYDKKDTLAKTLALNDYRQHLNQYWRAHSMTMSNHQTGDKTELNIDNIFFKRDLSEDDFSENRLKRVR